MGTWGAGTFESDAALDFVNDEIDRHVIAIEAILADEGRFRLDEDAEGELMPRVVMLTLLCEHCDGALPKDVDVDVWKVRYLAMFDDQINDWAPAERYKAERRPVIEATFNSLIEHQRE